MVLYITARDKRNIGANMHYKALCEIYGSKNIIFIDLAETGRETSSIYYSFAPNFSNKWETRVNNFINRFQGNTKIIGNSGIKTICKIVLENKPELIFTEESVLGSAYKTLKENMPNIRIICFYHDLSSDLFAQRMKMKDQYHFIYRNIDCPRYIAGEKLTQSICENWMFCSRDADLFQKKYGKCVNAIIPLSMDSPVMNTTHDVLDGEKKHVLFMGYNYAPNIHGIKWFFDKVLPKIKIDFSLDIIGRGSEVIEQYVTDKRVNIIGAVEYLTDYYMQSDCVIIPIFEGGGMKMKTLEALAYGKYIMSSKEGLNGYWDKLSESTKNKFVFMSDDSDEWASELNLLLNKDLKKYNSEVYDDFLNNFSYEKMKGDFRRLLKA